MKIEISKPKSIKVRGELRLINNNEGWVSINNKYAIKLKKIKNDFIISVYKRLPNDRPKRITSGTWNNGLFIELMSIHFNDADSQEDIDLLRDAISYYIAQWDAIVEEEMEREEAEIILSGHVKVVPKIISDKENLIHGVARLLVDELHAAVLRQETGGDLENLGLFCYNGKAWVPCEERARHFVGSILTDLQKRKIKNTDMREIEARVGLLNSRIVTQETAPSLSFENGVLNLECFLLKRDFEKCMRPHNPDIWVFHHIPHELNIDLIKEAKKGLEVYIPPRTPGDVVGLLKQLSPGAYEILRSFAWFEDISEEHLTKRVAFLLEMMGRGLYPGYRLQGAVVGIFKNIFWLLGPPNTGKSTFLTSFMGDQVLGRHNYAVVDLATLGSKDKESVRREIGKLHRLNPLVVYHLDIGKRTPVSDWSVIRSISGGDVVEGRLLYGDSFDTYPHYKLYLSSNDPPRIHEEGAAKDALMSRFKVFEARHVFMEDAPLTNLKERDIEAVILISLYALGIVYDTRSYSFTGIKDVEDALNRYTYPSYRVVMELVEQGRLVFGEGLSITSSELFNLSVEYVNELRKKYGFDESEEAEVEISEDHRRWLSIKYSLPDQSQFTKDLKKTLIKHGVRAVKRGNITVFKGIGIPRRGLF